MTTTPKQTKAELIAQCTRTIAEHCGVPAEHIISSDPRKGSQLQEARALLVRHLYAGGMSLHAICRVLGRSIDTVRRLQRSGSVRMEGGNRACLEALPRIPTTLQIAAPVTQNPQA
jgi:hypothetical protein